MTPEEKQRLADAKERGDLMRAYLRTSTQGREVGLSVVVGALLGFWIDRYPETQPWGMLIGLLFGCLTAARKMWRIVQRQKQISPDGPDVPGAYDDRP
jgi:F0F1-type ATP synthase assembly protein I